LTVRELLKKPVPGIIAGSATEFKNNKNI